ncbi:MAG: helix-hairpin-helix domain-containing protein [Bacillus sp. (in: firmicutes)]
MKNFLKHNKPALFIGLILLVAIGAYYFIQLEGDVGGTQISNDWIEEELPMDSNESQSLELEENPQEEENLVVDVKGAIKSPGVYEMRLGDRVIDVIEQAGGLHENADSNNINFAMKLVDEMVLYIPIVGEELTPEPTGGGVQNQDGGKVNLNKASEAELQTLTGVGPAKATAIIEYRDQNGGFKKVEEIMEISGIGEKTFEKFKDQITIR